MPGTLYTLKRIYQVKAPCFSEQKRAMQCTVTEEYEVLRFFVYIHLVQIKIIKVQ